jgi:hypothetical protein
VPGTCDVPSSGTQGIDSRIPTLVLCSSISTRY